MTDKKIILVETCDLSYANFISNNKYLREQDVELFNAYFRELRKRGGKARVTYQRKCYNNNYIGRFYPAGITHPLAYQWAKVRSLTCSETQVDIDAVKCHPSLILHLSKVYGVNAAEIQNYVANQDAYEARLQITPENLQAFQNHIQDPDSQPKDICKTVHTLLLYGAGEKRINETLGFELPANRYETFKKNVSKMAKAFCDLSVYKEIVSDYIKQAKIDKSPAPSPSACLSIILQHEESIILEKAISIAKKSGLTIRSFIYDGFQVDKANNIDLVIDLLNKELPLKFIVKPWKSPLQAEMPGLAAVREITTESLPKEEAFLEGTTLAIAEYFCELYGNDFIYSDNNLFAFDGRCWRRGNSKDTPLMIKLSVDFFEKLKNIRVGISNSENKDNRKEVSLKLEQIDVIIKKIQDIRFRKNVAEECFHIISKDNVVERNWECNPYLFLFNNVTFDLRTGKQVDKINREDYMLFTSGYDFTEPETSDMEQMKEIIDNIFPIPEERDCYLTILATGLCGITLQRFILANGSGGNGKGIINDYFLYCLGDYGITLNPSVLQMPLKDGASPELANLESKRFVLAREPNEHTDLNLSTIKAITGGEDITARLCHSNKTRISLKSTLVVECNKRPNFDVPPTDAVIRRCIDVLFRSKFVENPVEPHERKRDVMLTHPEVKRRLRCAMFLTILPYFQRYLQNSQELVIPKDFQIRMLAFLNTSDAVKQHFDELYRLTDDKTKMISAKDLLSSYKCTDYYRMLDRDKKRRITYAGFRDDLVSNSNFRGIYYEKYQPTINGVQQKHRSVLVGVELIPSEGDEPIL